MSTKCFFIILIFIICNCWFKLIWALFEPTLLLKSSGCLMSFVHKWQEVYFLLLSIYSFFDLLCIKLTWIEVLVVLVGTYLLPCLFESN